MGLDMFLTKKIYIGANYEHRKVTGAIDIAVDGEKVPINFNKVIYIEENVGYWRKANAIHSWFVENVQDGVDNCGSYYVSHDKLKELLDTVNEVLENFHLAENILPTTHGFFFGTTEYDNWYLQDLQNTKEILEEILKEQDGAKFYYQSNW